MGFNNNTSYSFSGNSLTSPNVVTFRPEMSYFIHSNICQNIVTSVGDYDYIYFSNHSAYEYAKPFSQKSSNLYSFQLRDENGELVNLNGVRFIFTLLLFQKDELSKMIKGFLKYSILEKTQE
eukprot:Lithocolla_globosa_v1_NODE_732_length_3370_cov_317.275935.p4 type:complete len:122 gc:universal NODE_732_length_3370_cov_317.275935:887-1252(+)